MGLVVERGGGPDKREGEQPGQGVIRAAPEEEDGDGDIPGGQEIVEHDERHRLGEPRRPRHREEQRAKHAAGVNGKESRLHAGHGRER